MSAVKNWKHFHSPGDKMSTFTRSIPVDAKEKATHVGRATSRGRSRKKLCAGDAAKTMLQRRG